MGEYEEAQNRYDAAVAAVANARQAILDAEAALHGAEREERGAHTALLTARATVSSGHYASGTRVQHHGFPEIKGTVVESDGTGIGVLQDGQDEPRYGFSSEEWDRIDSYLYPMGT